ncbi:MAG TPA: hypothetical protein VH305_03310 [Gaiella sp.]|jgi:hypothetical protein
MSALHDGQNVLVLVLDEHPDLGAVRDALRGTAQTSIRLVVPTHSGPFHWYATDEDEARAAADERAAEAEHALAPVADVEGSGGERDPVLAVEDALSEFRADRILVVGDEDAALDESLRRFAVPVEHLGKTPSGGGLQETGRAIMSGRSRGTPYAVFGGAMLVLGTVVGLLLLLAALILWV